ncbi:hypothetical protein OSTOST_03188 [Ostertagia ostertagi]
MHSQLRRRTHSDHSCGITATGRLDIFNSSLWLTARRLVDHEAINKRTSSCSTEPTHPRRQDDNIMVIKWRKKKNMRFDDASSN